MATFECRLLTRATRIKKGWKGNPGLPREDPASRDAKAGNWLVEPDGMMEAYPRVWSDSMFRANFEPVGKEAEELLYPPLPKEKVLYEDPVRGYYISLVNNEDGVWIRFKGPKRESCFNLVEVAAIRGLKTVEGPILREVLEDFVSHLGLETSS